MKNTIEKKDREFVELPGMKCNCGSWTDIDNGSLVKCENENDIFLIQNGYRHRVPNSTVYDNLFIDRTIIRSLDKDKFNRIPIGVELSDDACLIKGKNIDRVYLYSNFAKSYIRSMTDFNNAHFNEKRIKEKSQSEVDRIPTIRDFVIEKKKEIELELSTKLLEEIREAPKYGYYVDFEYTNWRLSRQKCHVLLPYEKESNKPNLPVLYLYHGLGGNHEWHNSGMIQNIIGYMISRKMIPDMIIVMPDIISYSLLPKTTTQELESDEILSLLENIPGDENCEEKVTDFKKFGEKSLGEIMKYVESNYPVLKDKKSRAIAGLSMGGTAALYHASQYFRDCFNSVGAFASATRLLRSCDLLGWIEIDGDFVLGTDESCFSFIGCGFKDANKRYTQYYSSVLNKNKIEHLCEIEIIPEERDHCWKAYMELLYAFLSYDFFRKY